MMYTSPMFVTEEAARSQVEHIQIQPRLTLEHRNCSNGGSQKYVSGLQHEQTLQARAVPLQLFKN